MISACYKKELTNPCSHYVQVMKDRPNHYLFTVSHTTGTISAEVNDEELDSIIKGLSVLKEMNTEV